MKHSNRYFPARFMRPVGLGELVPPRWPSARRWPTAMLRSNPALAAPFEHRMFGDEPALSTSVPVVVLARRGFR